MVASGAPRASEEPTLTFCLQIRYRFVRIELVNVISKRGLFERASKYPDATVAIQDWFDAARAADWRNLEEVRRTYPATDMVGALAVFNIKGNRYRLIARMAFPHRRIYIKEFLTHAEYDKGAWKKWLR
jgi:mRNA interferase HigB